MASCCVSVFVTEALLRGHGVWQVFIMCLVGVSRVSFSTAVVVEKSGGRLSSDAGLLLPREFDERIGLTARFMAMDYRTGSWERE